MQMFFREMQIQSENGEKLEREWYSKLDFYQEKYPQEAVEFKILLGGGLVPGWESSLPVIDLKVPLEFLCPDFCLNTI